jgi:hypothetical protein
MSKGRPLDQSLFWLVTTANLNVVGLGRKVSADRYGVPNPWIVGVGHIAVIVSAISRVHQAVVPEANGKRGLAEVVDVFGTNGHESIEIRRGGASLELEKQGTVGRQSGLAVHPTVGCGHIRACLKTCRDAVDRIVVTTSWVAVVAQPWLPGRISWCIADLSDCASAREGQDAERWNEPAA